MTFDDSMSRTINQEGKTVARKRGDEIKIRGVYTFENRAWNGNWRRDSPLRIGWEDKADISDIFL